MSITGFNQLVSKASSHLDAMHQTVPGMQHVIGIKNLLATCQLSTETNKDLMIGSKPEMVDYSEYGSTFLYSKVFSKAVDDLLARPGALTSSERSALHDWKRCTRAMGEVGAIYDYFRVSIPGVLSSFSRGHDPFSSTLSGVIAWFFLPSQQERRTVARGIVEKVKQLRNGESLVIPHGTIIHETLLVIEKDKKGGLSLKRFDPASPIATSFTLEDPQCLLDEGWWLKMVSKKLSQDAIELPVSCHENKERLPVQKRNTCFAHCHWSFFRHFLLKQLPRGSALILLERKIKSRILELSSSPHEHIKAFGNNLIAKRRLRDSLKGHELEVISLINSLLNQSREKKYFMFKGDAYKSDAEPVKYLLKLNQEDRKIPWMIQDRFKKALSIGSLNFSVLETHCKTWQTGTKKALVDYLRAKSAMREELRQRRMKRMETTLSLIETEANKIWTKFCRAIVGCVFWNEEALLDREIQLLGTNRDAALELFSYKGFYAYINTLKTPQELVDWSRRVLAQARSSRGFFLPKREAVAALKDYLRIHSSAWTDPDWIAAKEQLQKLIFCN